MTIQRKQNGVFEICISRHKSQRRVILRRQIETELVLNIEAPPSCEYNVVLLWKSWPETVLCDTMVLHKYPSVFPL